MLCFDTPLHRVTSERPFRKASLTALRNPNTMTWVAAVLILCQIADGVMTSIGLNRYGLHLEGNPALRAGMVAVGVVPALALAKSAAIAIIIWLRLLGDRVPWVGEALALLSLIYVSAAIIPWSCIILS